jgi:biopolymer transport protein ExbD
MKNRRALLLSLTSGLVALAVLAAPVIAAELFGVITKVDVAGKKLTVAPKEEGKDIEVTVTDDTEWITKKGSSKIDLEKVAKNVETAKEKNGKGLNVTIVHEKAVASKITPAAKKKAAN